MGVMRGRKFAEEERAGEELVELGWEDEPC